MKGENALQIEAAERRRDERLAAARKRPVLPASLTTLRRGDRVYYVPKDATRPHAMSRAEVTRAPRSDVRNPSVRLKFPDGEQLTVPLAQVSVQGVRAETPPWLNDARARPAWKRLVRAIQDGEDDVATAQRARQLAGMVLPKGSPVSTTVDVPRVLLDAARVDAQAQQERQAQRGGRGPVRPTHLPVPTDDLANLRLDQDQRAMVNNIARCIHRRYFLSDAELRELTETDREEEGRRHVLARFIRQAQADTGLLPVHDGSSGKGNALHGQLHDSLTRAYPLALEACQMLVAGKDDHAHTLALQVRELLEQYVQANTELDRARRKHHTGRYFHGDVLSVREAHEEGGMTQYYARLTIVYAEDGHSLVVANAAELESLTGTRAGPQAWASLCRWIEDHSDRAGGRRQGRRQDDDEHLIYREHDDRLELRVSVTAYSSLLRAFECIRRALLLDEAEKDVLHSEIPENHPAPGFHQAEGHFHEPR